MPSADREIRQLISDELARWPVEARFDRKKLHPVVVLAHGEKEQFVVFSGTRTDRRAMKNTVARVRRVCASLVGG